jgi:predicted GNAT family acetyltransferase
MPPASIVPSVEACRDAIGTRAASHIDLVWRDLVRGPGVEQNASFMRVVTGEAHLFGNVAVVSSPDDPEVARVAIRPLVEGNHPALLLYPRGVADAVAASVAASGFDDQGTMPAMAVDIERMPATALPQGCAFARVGAGEAGRAWTEAMAAGFALPPGVARLFSPDSLAPDMAPDAPTQFFAVVRDGRTVATSILYLADGLAGIYCVATLADERGKGFGAHVTAEALRVAGRLGYRVGILQSSTQGHSVYLGLGFLDVGGVRMFVRTPT